MTAPDARPVVLCYDGSERAGWAIRRAAKLLRPRPAILLHVYRESWKGDIAKSGRRIALEAGFQDVSAEEAGPAGPAGPGPVAGTVIEQARRHGAAAIVAGSHGRSASGAVLLGSVSSAVVHHSDLPVLVVRPEAPVAAPPAEEPIFICYDGSDVARRAIITAAEVLAARAAIVASYVPAVDDVIVLRSTLPWPAGGEMQERLASIDRQEVEGPLARAAEGVKSAAAAGLEARPDAIGGEGPAWERLLGEAVSEAAACIVVGRRPAVTQLGSTAYGLVHHADRPVLVVPGTSDAPPAGSRT